MKGQKYVRQYHDMEDSDYSACRYIAYYHFLCETCRSGEWKEQLSYAKTAYDLAKQYLQKYQTGQMLDEYQFAVMAFACYCRDGGLEEPAAEAERECEELAAAIKRDIFQGGRMRQERNVIPFISEKIAGRAVRNADHVMKSRREKVNEALDLVAFMREKSGAGGILSLEEVIEDVKDRKAPCMEFLSEQIMIMIDLSDVDLMAEIMTNEFLVRQPDDFEALILYIYMLALIMVRLEAHYEFIRYRESAWKELVGIRNEYIRFLPEECKKVFRNSSGRSAHLLR